MFTSNCEVEKRVESRNKKKKENETKYADGVMCVFARENALGNEETERKTLQKLQQK